METPASSRSQALSAINNNIPTSRKSEESEKKAQSRQTNMKKDRSVVVDITNDSPIVGLASGNLETPSSIAKKKDLPMKTPGSGEALLRCQVKTLLQKVEEEAEFSKLDFEHCPLVHDFPSGLLAPTPANTTPQVPNLFSASETRSLLLDFSEKSEDSDSSVLTYSQEKSVEEDDASVWSIQVNASSKDEEDDDEEEEEVFDELCQGLSKMSVEENRMMPQFKGKHTRFVYNEDDEIEGEEEVEDYDVSPGVLSLKGLPTPKGKHLRFNQEEEED